MFKDADDNAVNPELHLLRPSVDSSACIVALEPKKGRVRFLTRMLEYKFQCSYIP